MEVMAAMAIISVAVAALMQLFSASLRTVKHSEDYSLGLVRARSLMEEAYGMNDIEGLNESITYEDGFTAVRSAVEHSEEGGIRLYAITVTVGWPTGGSTTMSGMRAVNEKDE